MCDIGLRGLNRLCLVRLIESGTGSIQKYRTLRRGVDSDSRVGVGVTLLMETPTLGTFYFLIVH